MTLKYLGKMSFSGPPIVAGSLMPVPPGAPMCGLVMSAIGEVAVAISAAITGAINLSLELEITPPTLALTLQALLEFDAHLALALSLNLPQISFDVSLSLALDAVAKLNLSLALLIDLVALLNLEFGGALTNVFAGGVNGIGTGLGTVLAGGMTDWLLPSADVLILAALDFPSVSPPIPLPPDTAINKLKEFLPGITYGGFPSIRSFSFNNLGLMSTVTANAMAEAEAAINYQLELAVSLVAAFSARINITPPSFSASIDAMARFAADLRASLDLALPSVRFALDASVDFSIDLSARFSATLDLGLALNCPIAQMYAYSWSGTKADLAVALNLELISTWGDHGANDLPTFLPCHVAAIGASNPLAWGAVQSFFSGAFV